LTLEEELDIPDGWWIIRCDKGLNQIDFAPTIYILITNGKRSLGCNVLEHEFVQDKRIGWYFQKFLDKEAFLNQEEKYID